MNEFLKQKIAYREISDSMNACIVDPGMMLNNKCYLITGDHLIYILVFLNSRMFERIVLPQANLTGGKGEDFLNKIPLIEPSKREEEFVIDLYKKRDNNPDYFDQEIDLFFCSIFGLSEQEKTYLLG